MSVAPEKKVWRVVRYNKCKDSQSGFGYRLMPDDLIKLGRVRFKIKQIMSPAYSDLKRASERKKLRKRKNSLEKTDTDQQVEVIAEGFEDAKVLSPVPKQVKATSKDPAEESSTTKEVPLCRICLAEDNTDEHPLFSPCKCAGTMMYVHISCLNIWLTNKRISKEQRNTMTFYWKSLECELCKTTYPLTLNYKGKILQVLNFPLPHPDRAPEDQQFIILESVNSNSSKVIHVVNMEDSPEIKLGRGHEADVRVTDISVSRFHASIKKSEQGFFYLEDNHSKFGTLALVKQPVEILPN